MGWLSEAVEKMREKALSSGMYGDEGSGFDDEPAPRPRVETKTKTDLPPIRKVERDKSSDTREIPRKAGVVQMPGAAQGQSQIVIAAPKTVDDCEEICGYIREGSAVALNLGAVEKGHAQRIIDFACGVVTALDGEIRECAHSVFIIGPRHFTITGQHHEVLRKAGIIFPFGKFE